MKNLYRSVSSKSLISPYTGNEKWQNYETTYSLPDNVLGDEILPYTYLFKVTPLFPISENYLKAFAELFKKEYGNKCIVHFYKKSNVFFIKPLLSDKNTKEQLVDFFKIYLPMPKIEYVEYSAIESVNHSPDLNERYSSNVLRSKKKNPLF